MAKPEKFLPMKNSTSHLGYNDDPNQTPYNSFSSFKCLDNTVVSAYEVGIANGVNRTPNIRTSKTNHHQNSARKTSEQTVVPREERSLAQKPPSGAKLEHRSLGTTSKLKSLNEINTINYKGNKTPDSNVRKFDNSLVRHRPQEVSIQSVYTSGVCNVTNYQKDGVNKTVIEVDNSPSVEVIGELTRSTGIDKNESFQSTNCNIKRTGKNTALFSSEESKPVVLRKPKKFHGNSSVPERRRSLEDGIDLQSSNLVRVDSGEVYRSRLVQEGKGKRYSRRRHLSLQNLPTSETLATGREEWKSAGLSEHASDSSQSENQSMSSRRKLPKVPDKIRMSTKMMAEKEESGQRSDGQDLDLSDSISEPNSEPISDKGLNKQKHSKPLSDVHKQNVYVSRSEHVKQSMQAWDVYKQNKQDSRVNKLNTHATDTQKLGQNLRNEGTQDKQPDLSFTGETDSLCEISYSKYDNSRNAKTSSPTSVEVTYLKSQQSQLKTKAMSKMADCEISSGNNINFGTPQTLPSHKDPMRAQDTVIKREHKAHAQKERQVRSKSDLSANLEDKVRQKLKEIVASGSGGSHLSNPNEDISSGSVNKADLTLSDEKYTRYNVDKSSVGHPPDIVDNSAKDIEDSIYQTSPNSYGAKNNFNINETRIDTTVSDGDNNRNLPANSVFTFNPEVIQELTDIVMTKTESESQSQTPDISETQDSTSEARESVYSSVSDFSISTETDEKSMDSNHTNVVGKSSGLDKTTEDFTVNQSQKVDIEGKSHNGKNVCSKGCVDTVNASKDKDLVINQSDVTHRIQEKLENNTAPKQAHVLRTPSYRKRVMARAKLRYSKKSQNLKNCSCVRNENGMLEQCLFCKNFEIKKRSQTSLGHPALGEYSDSECSEIASPRRALTPELTGTSLGQGHISPRSVRKVNVSPRVDVLLSSNLFKKHLHKHENLLQKHTMSYKRFGMNKSVSNLDLSEGYTAGTDSSYVDNASEISEPVSERELLLDEEEQSSDSPGNRRHSLTGGTDIHFNDSHLKAMMKQKSKKSSDTLPSSFTKSRSRPGIGGLFDNVRSKTPARNHIPSFNEFRKQREKEVTTKDAGNMRVSAVKQKVEEMEPADEVTNVNLLSSDKEKTQNDLQLDLHTVLETDERGSKENLLSLSEDGQNKHDDAPNELSQKNVSDHCNPQVVIIKADAVQGEFVNNKPRTRIKAKSRTLPNIDLSIMSDNSSERSSNQSMKEKRRISAKRPRSVISKKSNPDSDTPDTSEKDQIIKTSVSARPKLKGHGKKIIRSESDSKYETEKGKNSEDLVDASKGVHSRHLSLLGKGHNSVSFNLDVQQNDGASDISSSVTESILSDSLHSELYVNETITSLHDAEDVLDGSTNEMSAAIKDDLAASVLRSTSDACEITPEAARKRRERKERPYKSDPFSGTEIIPATHRCAIREEKAKLREHLSFASSSKEEILNFLDGVSHSDLVHCESIRSLEELSEDEQKSNVESQASDEDHMRKLGKHPSNVSSLSTDSGVIGQDESHDSKQSSPSNTLTHSMSEHRTHRHQMNSYMRRTLSASCSDLSDIRNCGCHDCSSDQNQTLYICSNCEQRRIERKKIIQEVIDTELNYGRDLKILLEEFYKPMLKAGLLTKDQLDCIFLNLDELIHVNAHFITKLKAAINHSNQNEDEDLQEVMIGSLFLESSTMFLTFENYCVNQAQAPILLEQLEREKELLRIFLHVSQSDNHLLRRMHLKSFLMVPVQRIMKYPLLLDRLFKVTLDQHRDKEALREAKEKIEDILGHINAKSKSSNVKQRKGSEKHYSMTEKIEVSRVALETLGWNRKDVCDVITTRLHITQPLDHMWAAKKCKNHKFTTVHGVLLSLVQQNFSGKRNEEVSGNTIINTSINHNNNNNNNNNNNTNKNNNNNNFTNTINNSMQVQSAAVVLIKEKNGRYQVAREPFMLDKCVVSQDPDFMEVFELLEWNRESYLIKAENPTETKTWVQHLRRQMENLGCWRKRRNALPNILLNHLS